MRRFLLLLMVALAVSESAHARGLLIPEDKSLPPLAMLNHNVTIRIDDQVAATRVEQTFRNHTDRPLEATYIFPVPRGATVNKFTMWVDGKETAGELVEAQKARDIYTSIVRRTQDPGLLEYMGNNLLRMRVFPVPPRGEQKVAVRFTAIAPRDGNLVEFTYPLKSDAKSVATLEAFGIDAIVKSQHGIANVYSPTHAISLKRTSDQEVHVHFERNQGVLDKDFQLFYATGDKDVGVTFLSHRPMSSDNGFFTLLIAPRLHASKSYQVSRDMVLVLDTSGSMRGPKMEQARKAVKACLDSLGARDRFALINFATTVNKYRDGLTDANPEQLGAAKKWVEELEATGGTAIHDALGAALEMRSREEGRAFTIVFFTDGQPTVGETNPDKILKAAAEKNTASTRIFTFGVGDDVNATMLDQLADMSRAVSTYVRPAEDIEIKASGLIGKITNPVLTNLKLSITGDVKLSEVYPPQLPDLFQGSQLVAFGRFSGKGPAAIKLTGTVGMETREFVYEVTFPEKTGDERNFVEHVWARRKVGFMLDQIRSNGEKKELVDEVVALAKKYGITTPYTSYLIVPDGLPVTVHPHPGPRPRPVPLTRGFGGLPGALAPAGPGASALKVQEFARRMNAAPGQLAQNRGRLADTELARSAGAEGAGRALSDAFNKKAAYDRARDAFGRGEREAVQAGKLGVDLSVQMQNLRNQLRLEPTALKRVQGRNVMEVGGVWIDEGFDARQKVVVVKAQSDAYFRVLARRSEVKDVFSLGNHVVWVTPSNAALVVDTSEGRDNLSDAEIDALFARAK